MSLTPELGPKHILTCSVEASNPASLAMALRDMASFLEERYAAGQPVSGEAFTFSGRTDEYIYDCQHSLREVVV